MPMDMCRSLQALERAGLRPKFLEGTPFDGMVSLTRGMTVRFSTSSQHIVHRLQLGLQLIAAAQEAYPGQIHYHYSQQLDEVDFEGQQASFTSFDGREPQKHSYDLLIGADGANSRVRELMQVGQIMHACCPQARPSLSQALIRRCAQPVALQQVLGIIRITCGCRRRSNSKSGCHRGWAAHSGRIQQTFRPVKVIEYLKACKMGIAQGRTGVWPLWQSFGQVAWA